MRLVFFLALAAGVVVLTGCSSVGGSNASIDKTMLPLIPADTKVLADVQLDKLKSTPLYQHHQNDLSIPQIAGATDRIGIDPQRDVSEVLIAWNGKNPLFLVRGKFNPTQVAQKLNELHAPQTTYKNHQVFGDPRNSVAFITNDLAVAGDTQDVQRALDLAGTSANNVPEELQQRLRQVPKADQIWIVSNGLPFADAPMRSDIQSALSNITSFVNGATVGVMVDAGTHFKIDLTCISDEGAKRVHDALRGAIGLGRLSTKDNQQELMQVYDGLNVDQDKALVHVHADYSAQLTDKLFEEIKQFTPGQRR